MPRNQSLRPEIWGSSFGINTLETAWIATGEWSYKFRVTRARTMLLLTTTEPLTIRVMFTLYLEWPMISVATVSCKCQTLAVWWRTAGGKYLLNIWQLRTKYLLSSLSDLYLLETEASANALSSGTNIVVG